MPAARIIASKPSAARETAQALRQAGYTVEIVPPGTVSTGNFDLEFDADTDRVISESNDDYVPGQREFFLKPLWRRLAASYHAKQDVARAEHMQISKTRIATREVPAPSSLARRTERDPEEELRLEEQRRALAESQHLERKHAEELRAERERIEAQRAERERMELQRRQHAAEQQRQWEARQAELQRQEEARRQQVAHERSLEQQQLALQKQEEERRALQEARRIEEAELARQSQMAQQLHDAQQRETVRRQAEETHRQEVLRRRQEEEHARRAQAQSLLLAATRQREESARQRSVVAPVGPEAPFEETPPARGAALPTLFEYASLRIAQWRREHVSTAKVARIDRAASWRQALPITVGVASLCLLGWGVAAYRGAAPPPSARTRPPLLQQGQYAPYPLAKTPVQHSRTHIAKRRVREAGIAHDEVITRHYYTAKTATAQNTPRKKISDLN